MTDLPEFTDDGTGQPLPLVPRSCYDVDAKPLPIGGEIVLGCDVPGHPNHFAHVHAP